MTDVQPYRVLVTGSGHTSPADDRIIRRALAEEWAAPFRQGRPVVIIEGDCPYGGADVTARMFAREQPGCTFESYPAQWHRDGRDAGPLRNQRMVDTGADVCLAFPAPDSRGTWDCVKRAAAAGIVCHIYPIGAATR